MYGPPHHHYTSKHAGGVPPYPPQYQQPMNPYTSKYNGHPIQHFNPARPNVPYNPALLTNYSPNFNVNQANNNQQCNSYDHNLNVYSNNFTPTNNPLPTLPLSTETGPLLERIKVDAKTIFAKPGRDTRAKKIVVITRGLPGSGKTHYAKVLKDYETKYEGASPRIFCLDDYFMAEVDKEEEDMETGIKRKVKGLEYKFEQEMEEAYATSLFKAFMKCLAEGFFSFVIVDNINVHVRDYEQYCIAAMSAGYEVYILQTPTSDLKLLTQRNVHKRTLEEIQKMSIEWEETPYRYTVLSIDNLDNPLIDEITVVDMEEEVDSEKVGEEVVSEEKTVHDSKWAKLQTPKEKKAKEKQKHKNKGKENEKDKSNGKAAEEDTKKDTEMNKEAKIIETEKDSGAEAKSRGDEQDKRHNDIEEEILGKDKGKVLPSHEKQLSSIIKQTSGIEGVGTLKKKVRWADIEYQKELDHDAGVKRKHESDPEEEDSSNPKPKKAFTFLDRIREEQEKFKVNLVAKQALEQVKYIGPKETQGVFLEDLED